MEQKVVKEWKKEKVKDFAKLMDESKIVGIVNLANLPARQLQIMRETLRETVDLRMTRKTLMKLAFKASKKEGVAKLEEHLKGMPAFLFTDENPFKLYSKLKKNKSKAPIKGGQIAPNDLVVPAGPTSFPPGPIIGELGAFGIATSVEDGKVAVQKDSVVAKEGEEVSDALAGILSRMGIEPMEIGLDLVAVCEDGEIVTKDVLDIDEEAYLNNLKTASKWAFNLAFNAGFPTKDNINLMLSKAHGDALALAVGEDIMIDETVKGVLAKAESHVKALESKLDLSVPVEEKKEEPKEEKPAKEAEEKPAEGSEEPKEEVKEEEKAEEPKEETKEEPAEEVKEESKDSDETQKSND